MGTFWSSLWLSIRNLMSIVFGGTLTVTPAEGSTAAVTETIDFADSALGSFLEVVVNQPILLFFVGLAFFTIGISIFQRIRHAIA